MSLIPCSACGKRPHGQKLAQATWAWWNAANERVAWRQRLCIECYSETVEPLRVELDRQAMHTEADPSALICPMCHTSSLEDMDAVYATTYVPNFGPVRLEIPTCGACAVELRNRAMLGAVRLADREPESVGRGPQTDTPASEWERYGIASRE